MEDEILSNLNYQTFLGSNVPIPAGRFFYEHIFFFYKYDDEEHRMNGSGEQHA